MRQYLQMNIFKLETNQPQPKILLAKKPSFGSHHDAVLCHLLLLDHLAHFLLLLAFDLSPEEYLLPFLLVSFLQQD